jgi:hypothetical protein
MFGVGEDVAEAALADYPEQGVGVVEGADIHDLRDELPAAAQSLLLRPTPHVAAREAPQQGFIGTFVSLLIGAHFRSMNTSTPSCQIRNAASVDVAALAARGFTGVFGPTDPRASPSFETLGSTATLGRRHDAELGSVAR